MQSTFCANATKMRCSCSTTHRYTNNTCVVQSDYPLSLDSSVEGNTCAANYSDPAGSPFLPTLARNTCVVLITATATATATAAAAAIVVRRLWPSSLLSGVCVPAVWRFLL
jgi:hypothetical protein